MKLMDPMTLQQGDKVRIELAPHGRTRRHVGGRDRGPSGIFVIGQVGVNQYGVPCVHYKTKDGFHTKVVLTQLYDEPMMVVVEIGGFDQPTTPQPKQARICDCDYDTVIRVCGCQCGGQ